MGFSIRDWIGKSTVANQKGQAVTEYILILVVVVAIILGVIYQFNGAFKSWANNYFGTYLACLLETGELPTIGGSGGDSGLCNQLFKPFSLAEGRPLLNPEGRQQGGGSQGGNSGGSREGAQGSRGGGGSYSRVGSFGSFGSSRLGGRSGRGQTRRAKLGSAYTGSTEISNYGTGSQYSGLNRRLNTGVRQRLDNRFAFQEEREDRQSRKVASATKKENTGGERKNRMRVNRKETVKKQEFESREVTFSGFLRFLIIAAIIIAIVMFLGGQALQIGKSME